MASEDLLKKAVADPVLEMAQRILDMRDGKAPPLFPRVEGPHSVTIRYGVWEDDLFALATAALQNNTRPAPAATDTGLVTVETQLKTDAGLWVRYRPETMLRQAGGNKIRELCDRSQAEELLTAKDAYLREINELLDAGQGDDDGAQIIPDFEDGMSVLGKVEACLALLEDRRDVIEGFEVDNAAQEARIKELDRCHEGAIDLCNQKTAQIEALEAKLAAAEKALEPFVSFFNEAMKGFTEGYAERTPSDKPVLGWNNAYLLMRHFIEARAVLGGKS